MPVLGYEAPKVTDVLVTLSSSLATEEGATCMARARIRTKGKRLIAP